jgi:hypothetical protein
VYGEFRVRCDIHRTMPYRGARRIGTEEIVPFPVFGRAHRPRRKATTAVGAHILQNPFRTVCAEGALVTTDTRLKRGRCQRLVTVLTGRSEFEHGASPD